MFKKILQRKLALGIIFIPPSQKTTGKAVDECEEKAARRDVTKCASYSCRRDNPGEYAEIIAREFRHGLRAGVNKGNTGLPVGLFFIFLGFLCAFYIFKLITTLKKSASPSSLSLAMPQKFKERHSLEKYQQQLSAEKIDITIEKEAQQDPLKDLDKKDPDLSEKEGQQFVLNGIFSDKDGNLALINNRIVKEGDVVSGVRILHIYSDKVEMGSEGKKITLRMK